MLASINPLGERGRNQHYAVTVVVYIATSTVVAAALGGVLGVLGRPLARPGFAVPLVVAVALIGLACDAHVRGWRVPGPRRQVDENWLSTYRGWVYGAGFGAQLGAAFATIVPASATWVAFACAFVSGSPARGALIGAIYGGVRAVPVLTTARVREPAQLHACVRRLEQRRPWATRLTTSSQVVAVIVLGGALVGAVR